MNQQTPTDTAIDAETLALPVRAARTDRAADRFIYIAVPWSPAGGGMYKVADYLIQAQAEDTPEHAAQLRPLDTRGPGAAWTSMFALGKALWRIARGKMSGGLAGVHVNMAERL